MSDRLGRPGRLDLRLPPKPPERDGPPRRVHIQIEIIERRAPPAPLRYRPGSFALILSVLLVLAALAQAQPPDSQWHYEHWQDYGTGWHGETRTQGTTTDWDGYGPNGQHRHCHRYYVGTMPFTTCQ